MALSEGLLTVLACPRCRERVVPTGGGEGLVCAACCVRYPVRDGIPIMLADEAQEIGERESGIGDR